MGGGIPVKIKINNYKCIGEEFQGFEDIRFINVILGKNNSGKSALLEVIKKVVTSQFSFPRQTWHADKEPSLQLSSSISVSSLAPLGLPKAAGILVGRELPWVESGGSRKVDGYCQHAEYRLADPHLESILHHTKHFLSGRNYFNVAAERNITPEADSESLSMSAEGVGATNLVQRFINNSALPRELVEETLLKDLNKIFEPDCSFKRIVCQRNEDQKWEIYLAEEHKGMIALSQSGSGLKTVLMVLINFLLIPMLQRISLENCVYAFEELENNLHPAVLRRLLHYLVQKAVAHNCHMFITTHSSVEIDFFSKHKDCQIIHISHDGKVAKCNPISSRSNALNSLAELDVRASDLLQSNCIIWVEGPSDRSYLNKWIDLYSGGMLVEGVHYQCMFYGGRILSHFTMDPENPELVDVFTVNRNAIFLIDSDKESDSDSINDTKQRIVDEAIAMDALVWVTSGREVENYIPTSVLVEEFPSAVDLTLSQFTNIFDALKEHVKENRKRLASKYVFAELICEHLTKDKLGDALDLESRIVQVVEKIEKFNGL